MTTAFFGVTINIYAQNCDKKGGSVIIFMKGAGAVITLIRQNRSRTRPNPRRPQAAADGNRFMGKPPKKGGEKILFFISFCGIIEL